MRRRTKAKKDGAEYDVDEKPSSKTENAPVDFSSKATKSEQQDPLKWFGILVPQSLKQAQSSFKQGLLVFFLKKIMKIKR